MRNVGAVSVYRAEPSQGNPKVCQSSGKLVHGHVQLCSTDLGSVTLAE